jgi:hypothetical protein
MFNMILVIDSNRFLELNQITGLVNCSVHNPDKRNKELLTEITRHNTTSNHIRILQVPLKHREIIWKHAANHSASLSEERQAPNINYFPCVQAHSTINKSTDQQITNRTHHYHSKCRKWSLLLWVDSSYLHKIFTLIHWSSLSETEQTSDLKLGIFNPSLMCMMSEGIFMGAFQPGTNLIQFLFHEHSVFNLSNNDPICNYLRLREQFFCLELHHPETY